MFFFNRIQGSKLTICLAVSRTIKKDTPMTTVCQDHCKETLTQLHATWSLLGNLMLWGFIFKIANVTSSLWWKTEVNTGIICIWLVKWTIPSNPFNCCNETITAAPAMNPRRVAFERKSIRNPSLFTFSQISQSAFWLNIKKISPKKLKIKITHHYQD